MTTESIEMRALRWLAGDDNGSSSKAILRHMLGLSHDRWGAQYPSDGGDFGRCYRLLEAIPEWRERMPEMATHSPQWVALIAVWSDLERLHRTGGDVYGAMKAALWKPESTDSNMVRINSGTSMRFGPIGGKRR